MAGLAPQSMQSIILGCTEISLVGAEDAGMALFDTRAIHARAAARHALERPSS